MAQINSAHESEYAASLQFFCLNSLAILNNDLFISGVCYSVTAELIFGMVIMASGIARGRVRTTATPTTATVEFRRMAAILQIIG